MKLQQSGVQNTDFQIKNKMELTEKQIQAKDYVCVALDIDDKEEILATIEELKDVVGYFKLHFGITRHGMGLVEEIKKKGVKVFLDFKFHDIPNTVAGYARAATNMGIDIFNLHAAGGKAMMEAAVKGAEEEAERNCSIRPKIIAVTVLTSLDKDNLNNEIGISGEVEETVLRYGKLARESGLDGIVCSAADLKDIKDKMPEDTFYITPGIRPVGVNADDQKRVMTPQNAIKDGSSLLVIGRAITGADDKKKAAIEILDDIAEAL